MNIIHFDSPGEGFVWIAVLSVVAVALWLWERRKAH